MYGAPRLEDGTASLVFTPGSNWTIPIYSCISVAKGLIKTVSFRFNGSTDLSGLTVTSLSDKIYPNESSKPLWAVEQTELDLADVRPLWGLVSSENQGNVSLSTLRKESLYLPGYGGVPDYPSVPGFENLPGLDFYSNTLATVYQSSLSTIGLVDYTGESSLAMFRLWQNLSSSATTAHKITNLIWTDLAANSVVGTKSMATQETVQDSRNAVVTSNSITVPVTIYHRQILYHIPYAIPAFIVLFCILCTAVLTSGIAVFGHAGLSKMRKYLNITSPGRILTSLLPMGPSEGDKDAVVHQKPSQEWVDDVGKKQITIREGPNGEVIAETPQEPLRTSMVNRQV